MVIVILGIPFSVSWPHFREADAAEIDKVEGLKPNKTRHESFVVVQPVSLYTIPLLISDRGENF